jgi:hypothetical protein
LNAFHALVRLVPLVVIVFFFLPLQAWCVVPESQFLGIQADRVMRLSGLSMPLDASSQADGGRVVFEHVTVQSKKFGGLRIGLLPELAIEGMRVEVPDNQSAYLWTSALRHLWKRERLLQSARISGFSISDREGRKFLRAELANMKSDGSAMILNGVVTSATSRKISSAELALSGPRAGSVLIGPNRRPLPLFTSTNLPN